MGNNKISTPLSSVSGQILNDLVERNDDGELTNKTKRLFRANHGKSAYLFGKRKYRDVGVIDQKDIGQPQLANFLKNTELKYLGRVYKDGSTKLVVDNASVKQRSWFGKQLYKIGQGLGNYTKAQEVRTLAKDTLISKMQETLDSIQVLPKGSNPEAEKVFQTTIESWKTLIKKVIELEIESYSKGSGKQQLRIHKLFRISGVVDALIQYAIFHAETQANHIQAPDLNPKANDTVYQSISKVVDTMYTYKKSGGLHSLHNFISNLNKSVQKIEQRAMQQYTDALPPSPKKLKEFLLQFSKETNIKYSVPELLQLDVVKLCDVLIERLPTPVTEDMKKEILEVRKALLLSMNLGDSIVLVEKAPNINTNVDGISRLAEKNSVYAKSIILTLQAISNSFKGMNEQGGGKYINSRSSEIQHTEPSTHYLLNYIKGVYNVLREPNILEEKSKTSEKTNQSYKHNLGYLEFKKRLLALQMDRFTTVQNEQAILFKEVTKADVVNLIQETEKQIRALVSKEIIGKAVLQESFKVNLSKHAIRFGRFTSGIRKAFFSSSTVASKITRRAGVALGVATAAVAAPVFATEILALPLISNGNWAGVAAASLHSLVTGASITGAVAMTPMLFGLTSNAISNRLGRGLKDSFADSAYEDTHFYRDSSGYKSKESLWNLKSDSFNIQNKKELPKIQDVFSYESIKNDDMQSRMGKIKSIVTQYLPAWSSQYPESALSHIVSVLHEVDVKHPDKGPHNAYNGVFNVILPYLRHLKNPSLLREAYSDLQTTILDENGEYKDNILFTEFGKNANSNDDIRIKGDLKNMIDEAIRLLGKPNINISDIVLNVCNDTQKIINAIQFDDITTLTPWQKEFTPALLNQWAEKYNSNEIEQLVIAYMNRWLSKANYSIPGFIASMLHTCSQMKNFLDKDESKQQQQDGIVFRPFVRNTVVSAILNYISTIPNISTDRNCSNNVIEAVYMLNSPQTLQSSIKTGVLSHCKYSMPLYAIEDGVKNQYNNFLKTKGLLDNSINFPYVNTTLYPLQMLWQKMIVNDPIKENLLILNQELHRATTEGNTTELESAVATIVTILKNSKNKSLFSAMVLEPKISSLMYAILGKLIERMDATKDDNNVKGNLQQALSLLLVSVYPALKSNRQTKSLLLADLQVLSSALELSNEEILASVGIQKEEIEQMADSFRIRNLYINSRCLDYNNVSIKNLSPEMNDVMEALSLAIDNRNNKAVLVRNRVSELTGAYKDIFAIIQSSNWDLGETPFVETPFTQAIKMCISYIEQKEMSSASKSELSEALISTLCSAESIDKGVLRLKDGKFIYSADDATIDRANKQNVTLGIIQSLQSLYDKHVKSILPQRLEVEQWRRMRADNFEESIAEHARKNISAQMLAEQLNTYLSITLKTYLPIETETNPIGFTSYLVRMILGINSSILNENKEGGIYYSATLLQYLMQYVTEIENTSVRNEVIHEILQELCDPSTLESNQNVILRPQLCFEFALDSSYVKEKRYTDVPANQGYIGPILQDMLQHLKLLSDSNTEKGAISPLLDVQALHADLKKLHSVLEDEKSKVEEQEDTEKRLINVDTLKELLDTLTLAKQQAHVINQLQATPEIRKYFSESSLLLNSLVRMVESRKDIHLIKELLSTLNSYGVIADEYVSRNKAFVHIAEQKERGERVAYLEDFDVQPLQTMLSGIEEQGNIPNDVVEEMQYMVTSLFPVNQKIEEAKVDLFEHVLQDILFLDQPYPRAVLNSEFQNRFTKPQVPTYVVPMIQAVLEHLYSMEDEALASLYYKKLLELYSFYEKNITLHLISLGLLKTDELINDSVSQTHGNSYLSSLRTMIETSNAKLLQQGNIPVRITRVLQSLQQVESAIEEGNVSNIVLSISYLNQSISILEPRERESIALFTDTKKIVENIVNFLVKNQDESWMINSVVTLHNFLQNIPIFYPVYSYPNQAIYSDAQEVSQFIEVLVKKHNLVLDSWQQVDTNRLQQQILVFSEVLAPHASCSSIIRNYCEKYIPKNKTIPFPFGAIEHLLSAVLELKDEIPSEKGEMLDIQSFKKDFILALLDYINSEVFVAEYKTYAQEEIKKVLCVAKEFKTPVPVVQEKIVNLLATSIENRKGIYDGSIQSTILDKLSKMDESSKEVPLELQKALYAISELIHVRSFEERHIYGLWFMKNVYGLLEAFRTDVLNDNVLQSYFNSDQIVALMTILAMTSEIAHEESKEIIASLFDKFASFTVKKPHLLAIGLGEDNSIQTFDVVTSINTSLQEIVQKSFISSDGHLDFNIKSVLEGLGQSLPFAFKYKGSLNGEVDINLLKAVVTKVLQFNKRHDTEHRGAVIGFLESVLKDERIQKDVATIELINTELNKLKGYVLGMRQQVADLLSFSSVDNLSQENITLITQMIKELAHNCNANILKTFEEVCLKEQLEMFALRLLELIEYYGNKEDSEIAENALVILNMIVGTLDSLGMKKSTFVLSQLLRMNNYGALARYVAKEDLDQETTNVIMQLTYRYFLANKLSIKQLSDNLTKEEAKVFLRKFIECSISSDESAFSDGTTFINACSRLIPSNEWQSLVQFFNGQSTVSPQASVVEGIRLLYKNGVVGVENQSIANIEEYVLLLGVLASCINEEDADTQSIEPVETNYIASLAYIVQILRKKYPHNKSSYDALLRACGGLLQEVSDTSIRNEIRMAVEPSSLLIERTIQGLQTVNNMLWRDANLSLVHELPIMFDDISNRIDLITIETLQNCVDSGMLLQLGNKLLSFEEGKESAYFPIWSRLLTQIAQLLNETEIDEIVQLKEEIGAFLKNKRIQNSEQKAEKLIYNFLETDVKQLKVEELYSMLSSIRFSMENADIQRINNVLLQTMTNKIVSLPRWNQEPYYKETSLILKEIMRVLNPQLYKQDILAIQQILSPTSVAYNWLTVTDKDIKTSLLNVKEGNKKNAIKGYVRQYLDTYLPKDHSTPYMIGCVDHILRTTENLQFFDNKEESSCPPSIFSYPAEVLYAVLEYLQTTKIPTRVLQKVFAEITKTVCTSEYSDTKIPVYNTGCVVGHLDYIPKNPEKLQEGYIQVNRLLNEHSYTRNIGYALYMIQGKAFSQDIVSQDVFELSQSLSVLSYKNTLLAEDNSIVPHNAELLDYIVERINTRPLDGVIYQSMSRENLEAVVTFLEKEKQSYGPDLEAYANIVIQYCNNLISQIILSKVQPVSSLMLESWNQEFSTQIILDLIQYLQNNNYGVNDIIEEVQEKLSQFLKKYLPIQSTKYPQGIVNYILEQLYSINEAFVIVNAPSNIGVHYKAVWVQYLLQSIMNLEDSRIRDQAIIDTLNILCDENWMQSENGLAIEESWAFDKDMDEFQDIQGENTGKISFILEHMLKVFENNTSKSGISPLPRIFAMHQKLQNVSTSLKTMHQNANKETFVLIKDALHTMSLLSPQEEAYMLATPNIQAILKSSVRSLAQLDLKILSRIKLELMLRFCQMIKNYSRFPSKLLVEIESLQIVIQERINTVREDLKENYDSTILQEDIFNAFEQNSYINDSVDAVQQTLNNLIPIDIVPAEKRKPILAVFEHIICDIMLLKNAYPEKDSMSNPQKVSEKKYSPTYAVPLVQAVLSHIRRMKDIVLAKTCYNMLQDLYLYNNKEVNNAIIHTDIDSEQNIVSKNNKDLDLLYSTSLEAMFKLTHKFFNLKEFKTATQDVFHTNTQLIQSIAREEEFDIIMEDFTEVVESEKALPVYAEESLQLYPNVVDEIPNILRYMDKNVENLSIKGLLYLKYYIEKLYMYYPTYSELSPQFIIKEEAEALLNRVISTLEVNNITLEMQEGYRLLETAIAQFSRKIQLIDPDTAENSEKEHLLQYAELLSTHTFGKEVEEYLNTDSLYKALVALDAKNWDSLSEVARQYYMDACRKLYFFIIDKEDLKNLMDNLLDKMRTASIKAGIFDTNTLAVQIVLDNFLNTWETYNRTGNEELIQELNQQVELVKSIDYTTCRVEDLQVYTINYALETVQDIDWKELTQESFLVEYNILSTLRMMALEHGLGINIELLDTILLNMEPVLIAENIIQKQWDSKVEEFSRNLDNFNIYKATAEDKEFILQTAEKLFRADIIKEYNVELSPLYNSIEKLEQRQWDKDYRCHIQYYATLMRIFVENLEDTIVHAKASSLLSRLEMLSIVPDEIIKESQIRFVQFIRYLKDFIENESSLVHPEELIRSAYSTYEILSQNGIELGPNMLKVLDDTLAVLENQDISLFSIQELQTLKTSLHVLKDAISEDTETYNNIVQILEMLTTVISVWEVMPPQSTKALAIQEQFDTLLEDYKEQGIIQGKITLKDAFVTRATELSNEINNIPKEELNLDQLNTLLTTIERFNWDSKFYSSIKEFHIAVLSSFLPIVEGSEAYERLVDIINIIQDSLMRQKSLLEKVQQEIITFNTQYKDNVSYDERTKTNIVNNAKAIITLWKTVETEAPSLEPILEIIEPFFDEIMELSPTSGDCNEYIFLLTEIKAGLVTAKAQLVDEKIHELLQKMNLLIQWEQSSVQWTSVGDIEALCNLSTLVLAQDMGLFSKVVMMILERVRILSPEKLPVITTLLWNTVMQQNPSIKRSKMMGDLLATIDTFSINTLKTKLSTNERNYIFGMFSSCINKLYDEKTQQIKFQLFEEEYLNTILNEKPIRMHIEEIVVKMITTINNFQGPRWKNLNIKSYADLLVNKGQLLHDAYSYGINEFVQLIRKIFELYKQEKNPAGGILPGGKGELLSEMALNISDLFDGNTQACLNALFITEILEYTKNNIPLIHSKKEQGLILQKIFMDPVTNTFKDGLNFDTGIGKKTLNELWQYPGAQPSITSLTVMNHIVNLINEQEFLDIYQKGKKLTFAHAVHQNTLQTLSRVSFSNFAIFLRKAYMPDQVGVEHWEAMFNAFLRTINQTQYISEEDKPLYRFILLSVVCNKIVDQDYNKDKKVSVLESVQKALFKEFILQGQDGNQYLNTKLLSVNNILKDGKVVIQYSGPQNIYKEVFSNNTPLKDIIKVLFRISPNKPVAEDDSIAGQVHKRAMECLNQVVSFINNEQKERGGLNPFKISENDFKNISIKALLKDKILPASHPVYNMFVSYQDKTLETLLNDCIQDARSGSIATAEQKSFYKNLNTLFTVFDFTLDFKTLLQLFEKIFVFCGEIRPEMDKLLGKEIEKLIREKRPNFNDPELLNTMITIFEKVSSSDFADILEGMTTEANKNNAFDQTTIYTVLDGMTHYVTVLDATNQNKIKLKDILNDLLKSHSPRYSRIVYKDKLEQFLRSCIAKLG